jgi:hypothetical protein
VVQSSYTLQSHIGATNASCVHHPKLPRAKPAAVPVAPPVAVPAVRPNPVPPSVQPTKYASPTGAAAKPVGVSVAP